MYIYSVYFLNICFLFAQILALFAPRLKFHLKMNVVLQKLMYNNN